MSAVYTVESQTLPIEAPTEPSSFEFVSVRETIGLILALTLVPAILIALKNISGPWSDMLDKNFTLRQMPENIQREILGILMVPVAGLVVVFTRVSLGLRVLGPFRSILLAIAFHATGVVLGCVFLVITTAIVVFLREPIVLLRLPYFGRITIMLSITAAMMTVGTLASTWLDWRLLQGIAYFPIVVLCLVGDAFARTKNREGIRSALFRGLMTALVAVLLTGLIGMQVVRDALLAYPEILLTQIAGIVFLCKFCGWRCFAFLNPSAVTEDEEEEEVEEFEPVFKSS
ncbi:MAG: 7TM domain-containing protein [Pirellulaceae bacterium]